MVKKLGLCFEVFLIIFTSSLTYSKNSKMSTCLWLFDSSSILQLQWLWNCSTSGLMAIFVVWCSGLLKDKPLKVKLITQCIPSSHAWRTFNLALEAADTLPICRSESRWWEMSGERRSGKWIVLTLFLQCWDPSLKGKESFCIPLNPEIF